MKKTSRGNALTRPRLVVQQETIRRLAAVDLAWVAGGYTDESHKSGCPNCPTQ